MSTTITKESMNEFRNWLHSEERSEGTIAKYMRDLERLSAWLGKSCPRRWISIRKPPAP